MGGLFKIDGPVMSFLNKVADLIWLNVLFLVCSIPVFTIGASYTALYYVTIKMVKNEEGYLTKDFFKAFKSNFKQATIIWLFMLVMIVIIVINMYILGRVDVAIGPFMTVLVSFVAFVLAFLGLYVFAVLARFQNTIINTMVNSLLISLAQFPKTLVMLVLSAVPVVIVLINLVWLPIVLILGVSAVVYINSLFLVGIFKKFESVEKAEDEGNKGELPEENNEEEIIIKEE